MDCLTHGRFLCRNIKDWEGDIECDLVHVAGLWALNVYHLIVA